RWWPASLVLSYKDSCKIPTHGMEVAPGRRAAPRTHHIGGSRRSVENIPRVKLAQKGFDRKHARPVDLELTLAPIHDVAPSLHLTEEGGDALAVFGAIASTVLHFDRYHVVSAPKDEVH